MMDGKDDSMTGRKTSPKPRQPDRAPRDAPPPVPLCRYEELAMRENRAREAAARRESESRGGSS
jgi:hypothetical protein